MRAFLAIGALGSCLLFLPTCGGSGGEAAPDGGHPGNEDGSGAAGLTGTGGGAGTSTGSAGSGKAGTSAGASGASAAGAGGDASGAAGAGGASSGAAGAGDAATDAAGSAVAGTGGVAWRPFANDSIWNTPIPSGAAVDPDSATLIADLSTIPNQGQFWINIQQYSIPVYFVDKTMTPLVTVMAGLGGTGFRTGAADDSVAAGAGMVPIPVGAMPAMGTDKSLSIVDRNANIEWSFWNASNAGGWKASVAASLDLSGSGVRPSDQQNPWWAGHGARACGFGLIAGLMTVDQIKAGGLEHALVIAYPHIRSRYYTSPASTAQGTTDNTLQTRGILCGARVQLDPGLDVTKLGLSPTGLMIAHALQKYGAFIGDFSGSVTLYGDASPTAQAYWSTGALTNLDAQKIPLASLHVLKIGTTYDDKN
jgi:hypothetical protein